VARSATLAGSLAGGEGNTPRLTSTPPPGGQLALGLTMARAQTGSASLR
jgi:hypothetical protein